MSLISIILPTYNRVAFLKEAVQSVLNQTYDQFELLIVDDGSTDDTKKVVDSYNDGRIHFYSLSHSGKISMVRNYGISRARGDYIAFLDSDDWWEKDKLQKQLQLFESYPQIGFSVTDVRTFTEEKILIERSFPSKVSHECAWIFPWLISNRFLIYGSVLMVRKKCFEKVGYYPASLKDGDILLNMVLSYHFQAGILYEPLTWRRIHSGNTSEAIPMEYYQEYIFTFEFLYQCKLISRKRLRQSKSMAHIKMGQICKRNGKHNLSLHHFFKALRNNLFYPRHVLLLLKTYFSS